MTWSHVQRRRNLLHLLYFHTRKTFKTLKEKPMLL
ncbi:hypothetical protein AWRI1631_131820 [Saccharomyces cerevisiae AWRI1631]|uniref:Uncharacterized protein n=1 Tax=Saccharomyces cerevisiae (strain AWRI1631) TaxID=545124 RepID=B5VPH0_YEAS6|nr:hypothetical protein AWRI1631_131820 [Saccharomyces cerevisiae AWRI1631]